MKRIIVPTDFSDIAWNATIHALEYCVIFNAKLQLIHIYDYSSNELNTNFQNVVDAFNVEDETMKELVKKIRTIDKFSSVEIAGHCTGGKLTDNLDNMVNSEEDVVVIGSEGRSGIIGKLFGSNTTRAIRDTKCPILVIPPNFQFSKNTPITCAIDQNTKIKGFDLSLLEKLALIDEESLFKVVHIVDETKNVLHLEQFQNIKLKYDELVGNNISALLEKYTNFNESRNAGFN